MTLRGAGVDIDARRVVRVIVGLCLLGLAILTVALFLAGVHRNAQITQLRQHGVRVEVTVTGCIGLAGGSGSNLAGYACRGAFTIGGHRYTENIPGSTFYAPGATIRSVTVPGDPALLSPVRSVDNEHTSWRVFILPTILLVVLVLCVAALLVRRRRTSGASPRPPSATTPKRPF